MICVDANLLVYSVFCDLPQHRPARTWFESVVNGRSRVGLPWSSLLAFLRISTNPRVFGDPLPVAHAWRRVEEWMAIPSVWIPQPTKDHATVLARLLTSTHASGNLIPDAHLAALSMCHGLTLCSADSDFARFPGLDWTNPIR